MSYGHGDNLHYLSIRRLENKVIWELAEGLLLHNVKEYRHLAEILPEVYAEFKDNFRVGLD